mmetsp:Transcript_44856/g.70240  ORF Transcript_44856/g.70240 Transcript_44856/m.70240 type:complete len:217 (-) Transcript_44856:605-1255(-)
MEGCSVQTILGLPQHSIRLGFTGGALPLSTPQNCHLGITTLMFFENLNQLEGCLQKTWEESRKRCFRPVFFSQSVASAPAAAASSTSSPPPASSTVAEPIFTDVDLDLPASNVASVKSCFGSLSILFLLKAHEPITPGTASLGINDDRDGGDGAVGLHQAPKVVLCVREGQISNKQSNGPPPVMTCFPLHIILARQLPALPGWCSLLVCFNVISLE